MNALLQPASDPGETWRCESCGELIDLDEVIVEKDYGFEGEAWGTYFPAEVVTHALSPCCRAFILNDYGNFLPPELVTECPLW